MKAFLTMKHWQLFLLVVGFPLLLIGCVIALINVMDADWAIFLIFLISILSFFLSVLWFYFLVINLVQLYPPGVEFTNMKLFKICVFAQLILTGLAFLALIYFINYFDSDLNISLLLLVLFTLAGGLITIGNLYCIYRCAEALVTVEEQRKVTSGDIIVEFIFILYFWIIGIWVLQPRINHIFDSDHEVPAVSGS